MRRGGAVIKILFVKGDKSGCGFYRCDEPARVLRLLGHEVEIMTEIPVEAYLTPDGELHIDHFTVEADVIVVQRPVHRYLAQAFEFARDNGIPMIVDLDDDLERVDPLNVAARALDPRFNPDSNWNWLRRCCDAAARMTVSTPALQRYAPGRAEVVRNGIPAWVCDLSPAPPRPRLRLGWTGTLGTHPKDFHQVSGVIRHVLAETGAELHVIGESVGIRRALGLDDEPTETPWVDSVEDYLRVLTDLDVGIVPLEMSAFNQGKSALKSSELSAAGVPSVASPTAEYRLLAADGGCLTAERPRHWIKHLTGLLTDTDYRQETAGRFRETIKLRHTTELRAEQWEKALTF